MHSSPHREEETIVQHKGVFMKQVGLGSAVALIVSGTIGAGVLGIPYAIKEIGAIPGVFYIISLGLLMMGLNMLLGEVAIRTGKPLQLAGLAEAYLGKWGKRIMSIIFYSMLFGVQVVYLIGVGRSLSALLGGAAVGWSLLFFAVTVVPLMLGMRTIKSVEFVLTIAVLLVVLLIAGSGVPHINWFFVQQTNLASVLLPYGVILFAFHSTSAIPEAYSTLRNKGVLFHRAICYASIISIVVYALFAFVVVGITGPGTTEIATIGLGNTIGQSMILFGNVFAVLAMGTSYLLVGMSLSDSLQWDFGFSRKFALFATCSIPLLLFLCGIRQFIALIDFVGGVLVSIELILVVLIYLRAKKRGHIPDGVVMKHSLWLIILLLVAFSVGAIYSIIKLF